MESLWLGRNDIRNLLKQAENLSILAAFCYLSQFFDKVVTFRNHSERWLDIFSIKF